MQIIAVSVAAVADGARIVTPAQREAWKNKARELIDQAAKALAQKQDFAEVAKKFSKGPMGPEGGRWPIMEQGSFRHQQVEKAAFAQEPGQTSGVIETDAGFFIVKTLKRQDGEVMAFEAVQDEIVRKLREQRHQQLSSKYMAELAERAIIQAADRFEIAAVNAAVQRYLRR